MRSIKIACYPLVLGFAAWLVQELVRLPEQERDARTVTFSLPTYYIIGKNNYL